MLCITPRKYIKACGTTTGGIAKIMVFDPYDFDFTQTTTNGVKGPYTVVARRAVGSGGDATSHLSGSGVGTVTINDPGTGYTVAPVVSFTGGAGTGAVAVATVVNGEITGINVTTPGTGYTSAPTVVLTPVANTGKMYPYSFQRDEAEYKWSQTKTGGNSSYALELDFQLSGNNQDIANVLESLDAAGACCGLGFIVRLNDGTVLVLGELYVGGAEQIPTPMAQDGSSGGSGKLRTDANVSNLVFKGSNSHLPYEYSGTWLSLQPFID